MTIKTIPVAILYGGQSPEHDVSIASAKRIIADIDRELFSPVPIKISNDGNWQIADNAPQQHDPLSSLALNHAKLHNSAGKSQILAGWQDWFSVAFPLVHGPRGEDGSLQGLLELARIPYVGSGILASALGMEKDYARRLVAHQGINVVPYLVLSRYQWQHELKLMLDKIHSNFSPPWFVKPANLGSSIGITKVHHAAMLPTALEFAFSYANKVLVEPAITPLIELEVCVLESLSGPEPIVSKIGQVAHNDEYYTYDAKYTAGGADIIIPAPISAALTTQVTQMAAAIFTVLGISGIARVDFFVNPQTEQVYFNEINTAPGCTDSSACPQLMAASGWSMSTVITRLIHLALAKHNPEGPDK